MVGLKQANSDHNRRSRVKQSILSMIFSDLIKHLAVFVVYSFVKLFEILVVHLGETERWCKYAHYYVS